MTVVGIAAGLAISIALGGLVQRLLFETDATHPSTLAAAVVVLAAVALAAAVGPAWRAASVDPLDALKETP
jgi:ABC-type antimicrobial peptide transport system permease subunit